MRNLESPVRDDFPILQPSCGENPLVYLDSAATTQKPEVVIGRIADYYRGENANIHRGSYPLSIQADKSCEAARKTVQGWLGAALSREILFTKGSTESLNLLAHTALAAWAEPGDNVVVTELEHSSNFYPFQAQCRLRRVEFRVAPANRDGTLDPKAVERLIDSRTKLLSITAMSNVTGFRPDLIPLIRYAHDKGARVAVDASQEAAHHRINVQELDCDFLCFSAHKLYGPMGCGVLYGKAGALAELPPFLYGGDMLERAGDGSVEYKEAPGRFEAGTPNLEAVLGLEAAIRYLEEKDFDALTAYEEDLSRELRVRLSAVPGLRLHGPGDPSPILTFTMEGWGAYDIGTLLGNSGIAVRCGAHCAYPLMGRMGQENSCRVSLGFYNNAADLDALANRLENIGRRGFVHR